MRAHKPAACRQTDTHVHTRDTHVHVHISTHTQLCTVDRGQASLGKTSDAG
jgi:hypothetical protein